MPLITETDEDGNERPVSIDRVIACVFVSVEKERKKGKWFVFGSPKEEISFIVQVLWPFTIFKQPSRSWVIFESLGALNSRFTFGGIKFCEEFRKELRSMTPTRSSEDDFF